jgi:glucose/arabinose dehydrogenase
MQKFSIFTCLFLLAAQPLCAEVMQFGASRDNTLFERVAGDKSNGAGTGIFIGKVGAAGDFALRRAVVAFDLSELPPGAAVNSVSVTFTVNQVPQQGASPDTAALHLLQSDWGEGASAPPFGLGGAGAQSQPGDATWIHRFYDTDFWLAPGGDFEDVASATTPFGTSNPETMTFESTAQLVADVQSWLDNPASNFGWMVRGNELAVKNARRIASRESDTDPGPVLTVDYSIPSVLDHLSLVPLSIELTNPIGFAHAGDGSGRLFIVEQEGVIRIYDLNTETLLATPFLDIRGDVFSLLDSGGHNEQGLLGLAFHPDYQNNGRFYVNYTISPAVGEWRTVVAEFLVSSNPDVAQPAGQVLMQFPQENRNHNGGDLHFGADGFLYIASGDGGGADDFYRNAQNLDTLKGAMLRIDVDGAAPAESELCGSVPPHRYAIPAGNPFTGANDGCDEILHFGLRNPWRFSFDAVTQDLFIADVGQRFWEEVNTVAADSAAVNFGWSCREGAHDFPGAACISSYTDPVIEYSHSNNNCSITGGYVYRGSRLPLQGRYLYGDWCTHRIWIATRVGAGWISEEWGAGAAQLNSLSSFGQDENCELYVADRGLENEAGAVYRIEDSERVFTDGYESRLCR